MNAGAGAMYGNTNEGRIDIALARWDKGGVNSRWTHHGSFATREEAAAVGHLFVPMVRLAIESGIAEPDLDALLRRAAAAAASRPPVVF